MDEWEVGKIRIDEGNYSLIELCEIKFNTFKIIFLI